MYCCLEYKNLLILVTKSRRPMWHELCLDTHDPPYFMWKSHTMNLKATVICAITYLDNVYILGKSLIFLEFQMNAIQFVFSIQ